MRGFSCMSSLFGCSHTTTSHRWTLGSPSSCFLTLNWSSWNVHLRMMGKSSLGDPGPGDEATRDWSGKAGGERERERQRRIQSVEKVCAWVCVHVCAWVCVHLCVGVQILISASFQHFVKEPDGVHTHHCEFWKPPAVTSCYLLSQIKCHFLPPPLLPFLFSWSWQSAEFAFLVFHSRTFVKLPDK